VFGCFAELDDDVNDDDFTLGCGIDGCTIVGTLGCSVCSLVICDIEGWNNSFKRGRAECG